MPVYRVFGVMILFTTMKVSNCYHLTRMYDYLLASLLL
jgi:hypothetical protein